MKVNVGSNNEVKVGAVREMAPDYDFLSNAEIQGLSVNSEVSDQPKSLEETINGAINRAINSFNSCDYSFGIEDGLMAVAKTKTGFMNICACVIYDGSNFHMGLSSAFEYPIEVTKIVLLENVEINESFHRVGLTDNPKVGSAEGAISILTKGRLSRKEYTKQAVMNALIHLDNNKLYSI